MRTLPALVVLSWVGVAFLAILVATPSRIIFGSLSYTEGAHVLVVAALGIVTTGIVIAGVFGFSVRRSLLVVLLALAIVALSPHAHADPFMRTGENVLAPFAFVKFCEITLF